MSRRVTARLAHVPLGRTTRLLGLVLWAAAGLFGQTLTITPNPAIPPQGIKDVPYAGLSFTVAEGGVGPYTFDLVPLEGSFPDGLTLSTTGMLSGTPTKVASFDFRVRATDSTPGTPRTGESGIITINIVSPLTISPNPAIPPQATRGLPYGGFAFSVEGGNLPYSNFRLSSGELPDGLMLEPSSGMIFGTPTVAGSFPIRVSVDDSTQPVPLSATTSPINIVVVNPPLSIITVPPLPEGTVGETYSTPLQAAGGDGDAYTWMVLGTLPDGLSLTPSTGSNILLSGTPAAAGTFSFTLQVEDEDPATSPASTLFTLTIAPAAPGALTISANPATPPQATRGVAYVGFGFTVTGGIAPYSNFRVTEGTLPAGLAINPGNGDITGTSTVAGPFPIRVTVDDSTQPMPLSSTTSPITIVVVNPPLSIPTSSPLPSATVGVPYTAPLSATGGDGTRYNWTVSGSLPAGLSLNSTSGAAISLSGTPAAVGTFTFSIAVDDADTATSPATRQFSLTIGLPLPTISLLSPASVPQESSDTALTLLGSNFTPGAVVLFGQRELTPSVNAPTQLTVTIPEADLVNPRVVGVTVRNPDGQISAPLPFTIQAILPEPVITLLTPTSVNAGAGTTPLTVTGSHIGNGASIVFGGSILSSTVASSSSISTQVPPALLSNPGSVMVTVRNPDGKISNELIFNVLGDSPAPSLSGITPSAAVAGSGDTGMIVTGNNFAGGAVVLFGGTVLAPSSASSTSLSVTIPAADLVTPGTLSVTVRNPDNLISQPIGFQVLADTQLLILSAAQLPAGTRGEAYQTQLQAAGGLPPYTWSLAPESALPSGLSLSPGGLLSGSPGQGGSFRFVVRVTDSAAGGQQATAEREFLLQVSDFQVTTTSLPTARVGQSYTAQLQFSGGPTANPAEFRWVLLSGTNSLPPGLTFNSSTGVVSGTPSTIQGSSQNFPTEVAVEHIPTSQRTPARALIITVAADTLDISVQNLPVGTVGQPYGSDGAGITITALGGVPPYTIDLATDGIGQLQTAGFQIERPNATLPAAQVILRLSGTPVTAGEFTVRVIARDGAGTELQRELPLLVLPDALRITPTSLPPATINLPYQQTLSLEGLSPQELAPPSGQPAARWELVNAPAELSVNGSGLLAGTLPSIGQFTFTVRATTSLRTVSRQYVLTVDEAVPEITTAALPSAVIGTPYSAEISATGGTPGFTWQIVGITLPAGLSFDAGSVFTPTLRITGTPAAEAQTVTFAIAVRDVQNQTASRQFTLTVSSVTIPSLSLAPIPNPAPRQQRDVVLTLAEAFPQRLTGVATVTFEPNATNNADDPNVRFLVGPGNGRTATFTFAPNQTTALFPNVSQQQVQTGTVAGLVRVQATIDGGGPQTVAQIPIARAAPVILDGLTLQRSTQNANDFTLSLTGFSTPRDLSSAQVTFTAASGTNLQTTQLTIQLTDAATAWYTSAAGASNGSAFRLTIPFTVQGGANPVTSVSVSLTNSAGTSAARSVSF